MNKRLVILVNKNRTLGCVFRPHIDLVIVRPCGGSRGDAELTHKVVRAADGGNLDAVLTGVCRVLKAHIVRQLHGIVQRILVAADIHTGVKRLCPAVSVGEDNGDSSIDADLLRGAACGIGNGGATGGKGSSFNAELPQRRPDRYLCSV